MIFDAHLAILKTLAALVLEYWLFHQDAIFTLWVPTPWIGTNNVYTPIVSIPHFWRGMSFGAIYLHYLGFYGILGTIVPGPKTPFAKKTFLFSATTMARHGFGPYYGLWHMDTPSKCIVITPISRWMMRALSVGVLMPQPKLYHTYGTAILHNFFML